MSHNSTKLQVPVNLESPVVLRRFLQALVEQLDVAYGYRGDDKFISTSAFLGSSSIILEELAKSNSILAQAIVQAAEATLLAANEYTDENSTKNEEQAAIVDLSYTAVTRGALYVQAEAQQVADDVQTHADKLDTILAALRSADIITL